MKRTTAQMVKRCAVCAKRLTVSIRSDQTYRGGYYFGAVPIEGQKKDVEYWECRGCYRSA